MPIHNQAAATTSNLAEFLGNSTLQDHGVRITGDVDRGMYMRGYWDLNTRLTEIEDRFNSVSSSTSSTEPSRTITYQGGVIPFNYVQGTEVNYDWRTDTTTFTAPVSNASRYEISTDGTFMIYIDEPVEIEEPRIAPGLEDIDEVI